MQVLLFAFLYSACGFHAPGCVRTGSRQMPLRMMAGASAPGSGGMVDGVRIGPPPDMPSLLLNNRIVYLGMPINAAVTELIIGDAVEDEPGQPQVRVGLEAAVGDAGRRRMRMGERMMGVMIRSEEEDEEEDG